MAETFDPNNPLGIYQNVAGNAATDSRKFVTDQILASDPDFQRLIQQGKSLGLSKDALFRTDQGKQWYAQFLQTMQQKGYALPPARGGDTTLMPDPNTGTMVQADPGWGEFVSGAFGIGTGLLTAGLAGSAIPAATGGGGAATGAAGTGASGLTGAGEAAAIHSAAGVGGIVAPVVSSSPSLWASIAGPVIGAGTQLAGAAINAHAQGNATDAQAAANKDALDFQKQKLADEDQRLAPYRATGADAIGRLGSLYGFSGGSPTSGSTPLQIGMAGIPINLGSGTAAPGTAQAPTSGPPLQGGNLAALGQAPVAKPAQVGEQRIINGQRAQWDGHGWTAQGAA